MLLRLLQRNFDKFTIIQILLSIPVILFALTVHECSHGLVASWLGDPTAKNLGRLTLNPKKHLDPMGTVLMLLCGFGWAKPVPINSRNFRNPKWGMAISALAGPVSNLLLGFVSYNIFYALYIHLYIPNYSNSLIYIITYLFQIMAVMNVSLAVFNLIPIPPLDGSRVLFTFLPQRYYFEIMKYEQIISIVLMVGIMFGAFSGFLSNIVGWILGGFDKFASLIF